MRNVAASLRLVMREVDRGIGCNGTQWEALAAAGEMCSNRADAALVERHKTREVIKMQRWKDVTSFRDARLKLDGGWAGDVGNDSVRERWQNENTSPSEHSGTDL